MAEIQCAANGVASSTPGSDNYGKHMTAEEVIDFFAPHPSTTDAVIDWIISSGISADRVTISTNKQVRTSDIYEPSRVLHYTVNSNDLA